MESSATRQKTISLGKHLIDWLGDQHGADVMSRWMAHYIAEQITATETATGQAKSLAEKKCFSAILDLWKHRASLPPGQRPFENFEPIFRALEHLDPEEPGGFYYGFWREQSKPELGSVEAMIDFIVAIDNAARVLVEQALIEAIAKATDEKTKAILRDAGLKTTGRDIEAMQTLFELRHRFDANGVGGLEKVIDRLQDRLRTLDTFGNVCKAARVGMQKELRRLERASKSKAVQAPI